MPSSGLGVLMSVGKDVGLEDCEVLRSVELTLHGVKCFGENA